MFSWKEVEKTKVILSQVKSYKEIAGQHHVSIRPVDLLRWMEMAKEDLGYLTLVELAASDLSEIPEANYGFELTYHLLNMGNHQRLNIHVLFDEGERIPTIIDFFAHADWMEREQAEAFGILFNRPMAPLILPTSQNVFPLRKNAILKDWPQHTQEKLPLIRKNPNKSEEPYPEEFHEWRRYSVLSPMSQGLFEWWLCFDPVRVATSEAKIGFHHQGMEKLFEGKDWQQILQLVDKIQLGAAPTYAIAWARNLEDYLRIKLPERAQAIRIVMLELARIAEHLTVMYEISHGMKFHESRLFLDCREKVYELMEKYCGRRLGLGITRLGGIREDLPHGWIIEYQAVCDILTRNLHTINKSLLGQRKFREALRVGAVSAQTVLHWGVSGPSMRASGLNFDLRKSQPFYFYQDIDFDIPVGIHGTTYDRYLIRWEEIFQSFRIITQVIDNLPLGEIINPDYDKDYFALNEMLKETDHSHTWNYTGLESPNGEAGFLVMFDEIVRPYRIKVKTPSLALVQSLNNFMLGLDEEQVQGCLASLGIRRFEMDR